MGYRSGADANTREAMESKMTVGLETETAGVMGKPKETVAGMESGADSEVGMVSESRVDRSGAVAGGEASAIATGGGDAGADLRLVVAGTVTRDNVAVVAKVLVGPIAEMIPPECVAASEFVAPANARLRIAGPEMERVG